MLAIVYLALMVAVGDAIGRRFMPFLSVPHRWASAFLCGLLFSSWFTYLVALASASSPTPMFSGNLAFFVGTIALVYFLNRSSFNSGLTTSLDLTETSFQKWDWVLVGGFLVFSFWLMFRTFTMTDGNISLGHHQYPDFGSTVSIMQSFALGHNFPTEYPHFSAERIRYHFLFYFQAGNLEYLGLSVTWANNLLSALSLTSFLVVVMTLGSVVFRSRIVGRIGAVLFFFHGSLAFMPFLLANPSTAAITEKLAKMTMYLNSGFPYRGEDWGVWSQNVFLNQRHFSSSIAIFLLVVIFLIIRYREKQEFSSDVEVTTGVVTEDLTESEAERGIGPELETEAEDEPVEKIETASKTASPFFEQYSGYIFAGLLLGLLPMWNGPVYLSAAVVLAMFLLLFPLRKELLALAVTSAVIGLPQVIFLTTGGLRERGYSMFRWGFVIDNAGIFDVLYYNFFTFGSKWVLVAIALYFASGLQRRFLAAVFILFPLTYCFRFSEEVLANHKFLNIWLIVANVFVAYALVKLWNLKAGSTTMPSRIAAVLLGLLITIGGAIDLVPVWNSHFIQMKYEDDPLIEWVKTNTDPASVFLSQKYINHQILLAGRRLYYGDPYYAWSAGYDTPTREALVKKMFETQDPSELMRLLKEGNISYVAVDDMIRKTPAFIKSPNEAMIAKYFQLVFNDEKNAYANIKIYKVPDSINAPVTVENPSSDTPATGLFETSGQFARPRGITVDAAGNVYVADTGNGRIVKYDAAGKFLLAFGERGKNSGQLSEPNGIAVDEKRNIYVTDAGTHKLLRFNAEGQFEKEWSGPPGNFYGPRVLLIGPNKLIYIIDQGGTRIAKFDPALEEFQVWGSAGTAENQFNEPTGIAIGGGMVFVADAGNNRIQVFDLEGRFGRQFEVPAWERFGGHYPDIAYDDVKKLLYVSSGRTNEILAFDPEGKSLTGFKSDSEHILDNPSSMVIVGSKATRRLLVLNTGIGNIVSFTLTDKASK